MQKQRSLLLIGLFVVFGGQSFAQESADTDAVYTNLEYPAVIPGVGLERFGIDRLHSDLRFSIGFLGLNRIQGSFRKYDGAIMYHDDYPEKTSITLVIKTASINTQSDFRDKDLRSERFFDAEEYPTILFQSTSIRADGYDLTAYGELTIKGIKKNIYFPLTRTLTRTIDDGWGNVRIGFAGTLTINRNDFNIHGGDFWGIKVLSEDVEISFMILGTRSNVDRWGWPGGDYKSIGEELFNVINESGIEAGLYRYATLKEDASDEFSFGEDHLLAVGYKLRQHGRLNEAIAVFEVAEEEYPESIEVHNGLGLSLAMAGDSYKALAQFRRVLYLEPENASALEMVRTLSSVDAP